MKLKTFLMATTLVLTANAEAKIKVTVSKFTDKTARSSCTDEYREYWDRHLGIAFQEMMLTELMGIDSIEVLDRENIKNMHEQEFNLLNSEEAVTRERGKFKSADIAFVGAVTQFEFCAKKSGASIDVGKIIGFGSLKLGQKGSGAKVVVDIRAVDVRTGAVIASVKGIGVTNNDGYSLDLDVGGLDFDLNTEKNSPLGKASTEAIENATDKLIGKLRKRLKEKSLAKAR